MIELAFGESPAGALKLAKSMRCGQAMRGPVAVICAADGEARREAARGRTWQGADMEGGAADVQALTLALDIGPLSRHIGARRETLELLYGRYEGVAQSMAQSNERTLERLALAAREGGRVRLWVGAGDPAELCALYLICDQLPGARLSLVLLPAALEEDGRIAEYRSSGEVPPEAFGALAAREEALSEARRARYARLWQELARENAPLRALVNGRMMGVPEDFYDFALRAAMPEGKFPLARLLGRALTALPGVGDAWLYLRAMAMARAGELTQVAPAMDDHPYSGIYRRGPLAAPPAKERAR